MNLRYAAETPPERCQDEIYFNEILEVEENLGVTGKFPEDIRGCTGTYRKETRRENDRVVYKQVVDDPVRAKTDVCWIYYIDNNLCVGKGTVDYTFEKKSWSLWSTDCGHH